MNKGEGFLFQLCKKHHFGIDKAEKLAQSPDDSKFLMKTFSQIKSNVAVPIKKKVSHLVSPSWPTALHSFSVALTYLCVILSLLFLLLLYLPTQSSIPLPSRSKRTRRRNAWKDGSLMNCTKYLWTRTLSTIAWPMTWQTLCSVKADWTNPTYRFGSRFGKELVCSLNDPLP